MKRLQSLALRARQPVVVNVYHPAEGQRRVVDQVVLESSSRRNRPLYEREVRLLDRLRGELAA